MSTTSTRRDRIDALNYDYPVQDKIFIEHCNLCGSDKWTIITEHDRYGFPAQTACCDNCGLCMINPRMTENGYTEFYDSMYRPLVSAFHGRTIDAKSIQGEQAVYAEKMADFMAPFFTKEIHRRYLDVGGSTGVVARYFAKCFGFEGVVIDPAAKEIAESKALGIESVKEFIENWDPGNRRFDVIGMFQTMDHLIDIMATLKKIRSVVNADGWLIVDIVDFRAAYLKGVSIENATKIDHPYSLVKETAEAYLARTGFKAIRSAYMSNNHLAWICKPCKPSPNALPPDGFVREQNREMVFIRNLNPQYCGSKT